MIEIVNPEPDPSVKKEVVCCRCGIKLSYLPIDITIKTYTDISGCLDSYSYIICPKCKNMIDVKSF